LKEIVFFDLFATLCFAFVFKCVLHLSQGFDLFLQIQVLKRQVNQVQVSKS